MAKYTDAQNRAYGAGIGYALGKENKRVPVQDENKASFRKGVEKVRGKKTVVSASLTNADKIKYYSKRLDDPKCSEGQRKFAARRLRELAK